MTWLVSMVLTNAVLATLLAAIAWTVARCWRQPAIAHVLWVLVLLKLLTPPIVELPVGWKFEVSPPASRITEFSQARDRTARQEPSAPLVSVSHEFSSAAGAEATPTLEQPATGRPRQLTSSTTQSAASFPKSRFASSLRTAFFALVSWLPIIWLCGIAIRTVVLMRRVRAFHVFVRRAGFVDPALSRRVQQLAREAGLTSAPQVIAVHGAVSPMLCGAGGRIQLIFPARLASELSPPARDALLLHELAHYSRGDQWVRLVELATEVLYWWHPVVWWAGHEIEDAEEQCCDAWVVERQSGSRRTYAEALLATIDFLCEQPVALPPVASGLGTVRLLRIRLTQIMRGHVAARLSAGAKITVLIVAVIILPVGPALFGASVPPAQPLQRPKASVATDSSAPAENSASSASSTNSLDASYSAANLTALSFVPAMRPPTVVTATAVSRNGKYRLERRKGSHVTLVNQAIDWRLDMSTHGILCVAFTPDSRDFITGHEDGLVRVWDSETGGLVTTLRGCSDAVWSISISPGRTDEYLVAGGAKDGSVVVWDLESGEEMARLAGSASSVSCLRWSSRGDKLAISFGDFSNRDQDSLLIWSPLDNLTLSQSTLDRPVGALAWLDDDTRLRVADWSGETQIWEASGSSLQKGELLGQSDKQAVEAAHWSADCPLL